MANWNWQELATEFRLQKIIISKNQRAKSKIKEVLFVFYIVILISGLMQAETLSANSITPAQNQPLVTLEIVYHIPEASEVFIFWGVNGWGILDAERRPSGTTVKDSLMYTPMVQNQKTFTIKILVHCGTTVDYGFLITKKKDGKPTEIWDTNKEKNYHIAASKDKKYEIIKRSIDEAKGTTADLSSEKSLFAVTFVVFIVSVIVHLSTRQQKRKKLFDNPAVKIISTGLSLCFFLVIIRSHILGFDWRSLSSLLFIPKMILAGYYDIAYVVTLTVAFLGASVAARKSIKIRRLLYPAYTLVALFSLLVAFMNIRFVPMLGKPFTYQFLYYSDFLGSFDAQNVILSNISVFFVLNVTLICVTMIVFSSATNFGIHQLVPKISTPFLMAIVIGVVAVYFSCAKWYINNKSRNYSKLENPVVSFFKSFINSKRSPGIFTMGTPFGSEDFQPVSFSSENQFFIQTEKNHNISNVIIFVLESVPAEYLNTFDRMYSIMPELTKYLHQAASFKNIYAHAPSTPYALVSLLCSIYPGISYVNLTQYNPFVALPSLSSELKPQGYQTAFFSSADNRYQKQNTFLSVRQFDICQDYQSIDCKYKKFEVLDKSNFYDGVDDECTVNAFVKWAEEDRNRPFFAMLWTYQTHYPYFVSGVEKNYALKPEKFNRYLNALNHVDYLLGGLLRWLEEKNLSESTLVVVVGDHGEAFGRHGQQGHASKIYEENVHVPLILINKTLFKGEEYSTIGGLIDIAPTIMDILNFPQPPQWQGRSLFSNDRSERVYFFSPWFDNLFGFRQENLKFIFNASTHSYEVYCLDKDPEEKENLAGRFPEFVKIGEQRLAAWVQFQHKLQQSRADPGPRGPVVIGGID